MNKARFIFLILLSAGNFGCQYFDFNRKQEPSGQYYQNQWKKAHEYLQARDISNAEMLFKELYNANLAQDPALSTQALFELALMSEGRGQWDLALAQFRECETKKQYLPLLRGELELPARISGLYATLGEIKVSDIYSKKTEAALQTYAAQIRLDAQPAWWAETFYQMGYFPISEIKEDNWIYFASRFESTAPYLVRSMELADPTWSQKSYDLATMFIKKSLEQLQTNEPPTGENWVVKTAQFQERINVLGGIFEKLRIWRPLDLKKSKYISTFYDILALSEKDLQSRFISFRSYAPPSAETLKRNSIKRDGLKLSPLPRDVDKSQTDPNL